jgi:hypothetical protein
MRSATRALGKRVLILLVALPVCAYAAFYIPIVIGGRMEQAWHPVPATGASNAKALIFLPDDSPSGFTLYLISLPAAASFVAEHPGATFLLPSDRQREVEEQFDKRFRDHTILGISRTASGEQQITLEDFTRSGDFDGFRYIAYKDHAELSGYRHIGDRDGMVFVFLGMALAVLVPFVVALASFIWIFRRWRRECRALNASESPRPTS